MERPDIVIAHSNAASGDRIRERLQADGYKVAEPVADLRSLGPGSLALIEGSLSMTSGQFRTVHLLAGEDADLEHRSSSSSAEAIVSEPLRGRELEHSVRFALAPAGAQYRSRAHAVDPPLCDVHVGSRKE